MRLLRDWLRVGRSSDLFSLAILAVAASCTPHFTGPYPCETGYASCVNPSGNQCETDLETDGLHCGQCGKVCDVGAACVAGACGPGAQTIAPLNSGSALVRTNATAVSWSNMTFIYSLPMSASAGTTPTTIVADAVTCNDSGAPFAVDDANLYYLATGNGCAPTMGTCPGLMQVSLATMTPTLLVPSPQASGGGGANVCGSLAVDAMSVYLLLSQQSGNLVTYSVGRARIGVAGQTLEMLGSAKSYNGSSTSPLVVNSTSVLFETQGTNGSQILQMIPVGGGQMTTLPINVNSYGNRSPFVADDASAYVIGSGCPCNNDSNGSYQGPPQGVLAKVPLHGGSSVQLATFSGLVGDIAMDGADVYWSTDASAWKIPLAGGRAKVVAGNLTSGIAAYQCNGCGGAPSQPSALAVGSSGLYIAVPSPSSALLEVSK
jgi:hypothetical protein